MNITNQTKLYAIIGDPIEHSLSPIMHNLAFQHLHLNNVYLAFRVKTNELENAIVGMRGLGISGFNVTAPHKTSVIKYLDKIDQLAAEIGAVNTVVNNNGTLMGYNTDGLGALTALREEEVELNGRNVMILGAGGAAKALAFTIAPFTKSVLILNRTEYKAKDLAFYLKKNLGSNVEGKKLTESNLCKALVDIDILINTTSIGMYPRVNETPVKSNCFHPEMTVFDIVYNPLMTRLLKEAEAFGTQIIVGAKMLLYQGALAFELWTGRKAPVVEMYKAIERVLRGA